MAEQLSAQDLQDLQQIRKAMRPGDPRISKINTLLQGAGPLAEAGIPAQPEQDTSSVLGGILNRGKQAFQGLAALGPQTPGQGMVSALTMGAPTVGKMLKGLGQSEVQAAGQAKAQYQAGDKAHALITALAMANPLATGSVANINQLQAQGQGNEATGAGLTDAALLGLPLALRAILKNATPSALKAKASAGYNQVSQAVGDMPVNANPASETVFRMQELQDAGRNMPRFATKFIQRVTNPAKGPLTYDEARDFSSAAGEMSANEAARLTPAMRTQVKLFRNAIEKDIADTAAQAQLRDVYQSAKGNYRRATTIANRGNATIDYLLQQAKDKLPWLATGYGMKKIYEGTK